MRNSSLNLKNKNSIILLSFLVLGMLILSFASVPLYDLFCRVTGYGGTVQRASIAPGSNGDLPKIQIRFDANVSKCFYSRPASSSKIKFVVLLAPLRRL